jgi:hypothetical protein
MTSNPTHLPPPTDIPGVFRRAATIITVNGLHQGDLLADPCNRCGTALPDAQRPMSLASAIRCAATGDPRLDNALSRAALAFAAARLTADGDVCIYASSRLDVDWHLQAWNDRPHVTARLAARVLYMLAAQAEAAAAPLAVAA